MSKICIVTLGCPKNVVESENIAGMLESKGHTLSADPNDCECALVHTCSFIEDAKKESELFIDALLTLKKRRKIGKVFVSGCMVQSEGKKLISRFPDADGFVGTGELDKIPEVIGMGNGFLRKKPGGLLESPFPRIVAVKSASAYLRIAEGCNHRCGFCSIPSIRGRYKSRKIENIFEETEGMAAAGIREVVLVAQDTTSYGKDIYGCYALPKLIERLSNISKIEWIRILYGYPLSMTNDLISCFRKFPKLCRYIDLPLQHISERVLRNMGRPGGARKTVERIKKVIPDIAIRSSVIAGFPGETKKDFEELLSFVKDGWFDHLGVFEYSDNPETKSFAQRGKIGRLEKKFRKNRLMEAQKAAVKEKNRRKLNTVQKILVEKKGEGNRFEGRASFQAPEVDSKIIFEANGVRTNFVNVLITGYKGYDLTGKTIF